MVGIILLGQSNSGKSTIGKAVARMLGIRYISSGDIARSMDIQKDLNSGKMAPEDKMREMILQKISHNEPYILDGFPRFYEQYEWLNQHVNYPLIYMNIDVPREDILARAALRNRSDDDSINKKMQFYEEKTEPMIRKMIRNGEYVYNINNSNAVGTRSAINNMFSIVYRTLEEDTHANNSQI